MEPAAIERPLLSTLWALPVPQHSSACRGLGSCAGSGQGKGHGGGGQHKHRQERRLQLALPWEALLCSTLRTRSGGQEWVSGEISDCPDLCQLTGSSLGQAGLWKRGMKAQLCCLLASGAGLSHSALDSLNTGIFNPCQNLLLDLSLHAVLVVQGRAGWIHVEAGTMGNSEGMPPPSQLLRLLGTRAQSLWHRALPAQAGGTAMVQGQPWPSRWEQLFGWGSLKGL